jgi:hypothetical protein
MFFKDLKIDAIRVALKLHKGDKNKAAQYLGISVRSIRNYCIERAELAKWYCPPPALLKIFGSCQTDLEAFDKLQKSKTWLKSNFNQRKKIVEKLEAYFDQKRKKERPR